MTPVLFYGMIIIEIGENVYKDVDNVVSKYLKNKVYKRTRKYFFQNSLPLLLGQGLILIFFFIVFTPLVTFVYEKTLRLTGLSYVTVANIRTFLLNPMSIFVIFSLFYLFGLFWLFEIYFLIHSFSNKERGEKVPVLQTLFRALYRAIAGIFKGNLRLLLAAWLLLFVYNIPFVLYAIRKIRWVNFLALLIPRQVSLPLSVLLLILLSYLIFFRMGYVFHYYIICKLSCKEAFFEARQAKKNHACKSFLYFVGWNLGIAFALIVFYILRILLTTLLVSATFNPHLSIAMFISIMEQTEPMVLILLLLASTIANFALSTHLFYHYVKPETAMGTDPEESVNYEKRPAYKRIFLVLLGMILLMDLFFFFDIIKNGSALDYLNLDAIKVTSHRGFSKQVPENTLPAIEKAIEEQVDFVEVDVRETKDGELVLLHDSSLKRTCGLNKNIWNVTYEEVSRLDAGKWKGKEYEGVRVPTLREVLELCKGRVSLNLDLKYHNEKEKMEEKVVSLIQEYDMEWQCVITSTNISCLTRVKALSNNLQTGYITYQLYPGLVKNDAVDFFSMKSSLVTKNVVQLIHKNGKNLCVWTVNSKNELERLSRIGVDNIITDNPAYAKEILYQESSDGYLLTVFKIIRE
ncbi:MAG: glycerophosphoryl diester phosphodiesterase [Clostridiales bacterium]|nr:glycerophosphoryl diester phosphodiesterase [Clostridiales bacterium]